MNTAIGAEAAGDLARQAGGDLVRRLEVSLVRLEVSLVRLEVSLERSLTSRLERSLTSRLTRSLTSRLKRILTTRLTTRLSPTQWTWTQKKPKRKQTSPETLPRWPKRLPAAVPLPPLELARPPWFAIR